MRQTRQITRAMFLAVARQRFEMRLLLGETLELTERGIASTDKNETHIGIRNPADLPQVRGRPHGS
jgi:hypothetical protein